jgi:hypothetical protein
MGQVEIDYFDPDDHRNIKETQRMEDEEALKHGLITPHELEQKNSFFYAFKDNIKLIKRRVKLKGL